MAKKLNAGKTPDRHSKNRKRQSSPAPNKTNRNVGQGPTRSEEEPVSEGIPEEHYYGERRSRTPGNPEDRTGSLDEETLSQDAPYNGTYGRLGPDRERS